MIQWLTLICKRHKIIEQEKFEYTELIRQSNVTRRHVKVNIYYNKKIIMRNLDRQNMILRFLMVLFCRGTITV
jgi:hypothetical protein